MRVAPVIIAENDRPSFFDPSAGELLEDETHLDGTLQSVARSDVFLHIATTRRKAVQRSARDHLQAISDLLVVRNCAYSPVQPPKFRGRLGTGHSNSMCSTELFRRTRRACIMKLYSLEENVRMSGTVQARITSIQPAILEV